MSILHWVAGLVALAALAGLVAFAFRQGMKVRPSGKADDGDIAAGWTTSGEGIGGESHGGVDGN
jgi:hypothetical protein